MESSNCNDSLLLVFKNNVTVVLLPGFPQAGSSRLHWRVIVKLLGNLANVIICNATGFPQTTQQSSVDSCRIVADGMFTCGSNKQTMKFQQNPSQRIKVSCLMTITENARNAYIALDRGRTS